MNDRYVAQWLETLARLAKQRGFSVECWGNSGKLPLLGFVRTGNENAPRIYLSAGIHGDEPAGPPAIERLLRDDHLSPSLNWTICPLLNPCGYAAGSRHTPEGIDLNRDYKQFRAAESAAHAAWLKGAPANDLYLSLHEDWETGGFYLYEINNSPVPAFGEAIVEAVAEVIPAESRSVIDDHRTAAPGVIRHSPSPDEPDNWPEAIYHFVLYPHLSYTFETPSSLRIETRIRAHIVAVKTALELFSERRDKEV